jgi:hypothetical protein
MDRFHSAIARYTILNYLQLRKRTGPAIWHPLISDWKAIVRREKKEAAEFKNDFSKSLGLLKSCRQVYHETAGIQNVFVISRSRIRHNKDWKTPYFWQYDQDDLAYNQINLVPQWFLSIGAQYDLLRNVVIDTDAFCSPSTERHEVLSLLRMIWMHPKRISNAICKEFFYHPVSAFQVPSIWPHNRSIPKSKRLRS